MGPGRCRPHQPSAGSQVGRVTRTASQRHPELADGSPRPALASKGLGTRQPRTCHSRNAPAAELSLLSQDREGSAWVAWIGTQDRARAVSG